MFVDVKMRRRSTSAPTEGASTPEEPKVSWKKNTDYFMKLESAVENADGGLEYYGNQLVEYKEQLESADASPPLEEISRIASSFRMDTGYYASTVHAVLEHLHGTHDEISAALDEEDRVVEAVTSEEERPLQARMRLSAQLVGRWMRAGHPHQLAAPFASRRDEHSSSYLEDLGNGIELEKMNREAATKTLQGETSLDETLESRESETEELADEESGGATDYRAEPEPSAGGSSEGQTDASRDAPADQAASGGVGATGRSSSGDAGNCSGQPAAGDGAAVGNEGDQKVSPVKSGATQYSSAASTSFQSYHSVTSGEEADCEAETTTATATATITEMSNGNGTCKGDGNGNANGNGNTKGNGSGNGNGNNRVGVQSTASQTDESWIQWDSVDLAVFDKDSPWSVLHELRRQHGLLRATLQRHLDRLSRVAVASLHLQVQLQLVAPAQGRRVSWLLRAELVDSLRAMASEVRATRHALRMRAARLRNFAASVWRIRPLMPPPADAPRQLLAAASTRRRRPLEVALRRAVAYLFCIRGQH